MIWYTSGILEHSLQNILIAACRFWLVAGVEGALAVRRHQRVHLRGLRLDVDAPLVPVEVENALRKGSKFSQSKFRIGEEKECKGEGKETYGDEEAPLAARRR